MNVEYTGRRFEITPAIRKEVETGLVKIRKILRDKFETKVILAVEKRRNKAEITINPRNGPLVAPHSTTPPPISTSRIDVGRRMPPGYTECVLRESNIRPQVVTVAAGGAICDRLAAGASVAGKA